MLELPSLLDAEVGHVLREAVVENRSLGAFKVNRRVFTDEAVLAAERRIIFDHCWLYLGHASEVPDPSSFVTRSVGGRPLIFNRGRDGTIQASDLARAFGWLSVPVPKAGVSLTAGAVDLLPFMPPSASWINAMRVPVVMDTTRAREQLGWEPLYDTRAVLEDTVSSARDAGLL